MSLAAPFKLSISNLKQELLARQDEGHQAQGYGCSESCWPRSLLRLLDQDHSSIVFALQLPVVVVQLLALIVLDLLELIDLVQGHGEGLGQHNPCDGLGAGGRGQGAGVGEVVLHTGHQVIHCQGIRHQNGLVHAIVALNGSQTLDDATYGLVGRVGHMVQHSNDHNAIFKVGRHCHVRVYGIPVHDVHFQRIPDVVDGVLRPPMHVDLLHHKVLQQGTTTQGQFVIEAR